MTEENQMWPSQNTKHITTEEIYGTDESKLAEIRFS